MIQYIPICGSTPATVEIERIEIVHDKDWDKRWAILDCRFIKPSTIANLDSNTFECFFAVNDAFSFGKRYKVGDSLHFRFQRYDFGPVKKKDPRLLVLKKFFGIEAMPNEYGDELFVLVSESDVRK